MKNLGVCYPEELDGILDALQGTANCCKFNRWGSLVAVGSIDGRVFIYDVITKGVVKTCGNHGVPITSLSWSRNGRKLLTASTDWSVVIWDVLEGARLERFVYGNAVISAMFNPRSFFKTSQKIANNQLGDILVATFDRRGKYIVTGSSKGRIAFYDSKTVNLVTHIKQGNSFHQIKNIVLSCRHDFLITNSQDRIIRTYNMNNLLKRPPGSVVEPMQKLLDIVNRASWKTICVSNDGDYICGGSAKGHSLYIWERNSGSLIKILHGTKGEVLHDVQWHPTRPIILSVAHGIVSVWTQAHVENWSAFAPDFTELEENTKYIEKESEFDLEDEDASNAEENSVQEDDNEIINVIEMKSSNTFYCSSDEDSESSMRPNDLSSKTGPLWFIPITPESESFDENVSVNIGNFI
ncbi:unnamed protein product [Dracunculus medinensis]|uniref:WD_REPEATS_REGION domain-containing protein n=1 Tax=Dracunculus medinensis TaxID=318479 RepID=A0A0N4U3D9_DRAME|nr:unnamed protein product [Dracunculus medinensis]